VQFIIGINKGRSINIVENISKLPIETFVIQMLTANQEFEIEWRDMQALNGNSLD
jgi:hypothetical protein